MGQLLQNNNQRPVIVVSEPVPKVGQLAVEFVRMGAADFVVKPFSDSDALDRAIREAVGCRHEVDKSTKSKNAGAPKVFVGGEILLRVSE